MMQIRYTVMNKSLRISTLAMALACSFAAVLPMQVQATGLIAGATEPTQIANNMELAASLVEQATTASATVAAKITLAQQYITMLQNIKNLPQNMLNELSKPYKDQIKALHDQVLRTSPLYDTFRNPVDIKVSTG